MNRIDRYLIRSIFALTGLVALVLISIYSFVVFVSDLGATGDDFGIGQLFQYTALMVPANAYILLPIIALLGALLGLGNLAHGGELTAMRSAGVSWNRIGRAALTAGVVLGLAGFALGNWLGPLGRQQAELLRQHGHVGPDKSEWLRKSGSIVRIRDLRSENEIGGVTIYTLGSGGRIVSMTQAGSAAYADGKWQLLQVRRSDFDDAGVRVSTQAKAPWRDGVEPNVLKLFILEENSLSLSGLGHLIAYMRENNLDSSKYRMLLWRKLVEPFSIMAMMLIAVPFAGGRLRETGTGQRLLVGILVGVVFYVGDKISVSLGDVYGWSPPLAAAFPTVLLALAGWLALQRTR